MQMLNLLAANPLEHVLPHPLFQIGPVVVNNQMFMALVAAVLMLLIFPTLFKRAESGPPKGTKNFFEAIMEFLRVEVFRPALKEHTDRFVPFLWTLFFFILFCNLLGQLPIGELVTFFTGKECHLGATATGSLITTGVLAACAFIFIHVNGIDEVAKALMNGTYGHHGHHEEHSSDGAKGHEASHDLEHSRGDALAADVPGNFKALADPTAHYADDQHVGHDPHRPDHGRTDPGGIKLSPAQAILQAVPLYFWNFAPHPFKPAPGEPAYKWAPDILIWGLLLILELVGAVIKPFALMIRLFANMIAGHIVLAALIVLIPMGSGILAQIGVGIPVTILSLLIRVLELFVSFLQAYVFTFLVTLFIASAVAPEH